MKIAWFKIPINVEKEKGEELEASELETVLTIQIGNKLNFESHIKSATGLEPRTPYFVNEQNLRKTRGITNNVKSVRYAKEKSFVQFYN